MARAPSYVTKKEFDGWRKAVEKDLSDITKILKKLDKILGHCPPKTRKNKL
jgi:hypothetical protein